MNQDICKRETFLSRHGDILALVFSISALFLWSRSETRSDCRRIEDLMTNMHQEIYLEMKDFHGRLCTIEERNSKGGK